MLLSLGRLSSLFMRDYWKAFFSIPLGRPLAWLANQLARSFTHYQFLTKRIGIIGKDNSIGGCLYRSAISSKGYLKSQANQYLYIYIYARMGAMVACFIHLPGVFRCGDRSYHEPLCC
uniref:Uncharacterized protein n=1 Tax=Picea glauca TaxID=3330 RepID=A0A124GMH8_PICGL|nr:hypothetical protein ABT39_MTgene2292 [Picea glauca]